MACLIALVAGVNGAVAEGDPPRPRLKPAPPAAVDTTPRGTGGSVASPVLACLERLHGIGAAATAEEPVSSANGCGIAHPVKLNSVRSGGDVMMLGDGPILNCDFAVMLARWSANVVSPLARHHLGSPVRHMQVGPGYVCRGRNGATTGKLSEHAFGNALDIVGLTLADGTKIMIAEDPSATGARKSFFAAMRTSACGFFTTVLGPGSNDAHSSHYHVDLGKHGRSDRYRICQ